MGIDDTLREMGAQTGDNVRILDLEFDYEDFQEAKMDFNDLNIEDVNVKKDDVVVRNQVIGTSGTCKLYSTDSNLHFELTYQGKNINPEEYYNKTTDELQAYAFFSLI